MPKDIFEDIDNIIDNSIYDVYVKDDFYSYIFEKINNNKSLTIGEKTFLWQNYDEYIPKTKNDLINLLREYYIKRNVTNFNFIDVSNVTDMSKLFYKTAIEYIEIDEWDVSNVKDMALMFYGCFKFNADLSRWNVSNVKNMGWNVF